MTFQGTAIPTGVVQSTYPNQMGTALPGLLANATDVNLVDSLAVAGTGPITTGRAAFYATNTYNARAGINAQTALNATDAVAAGTATAANFLGIALRALAGWSSTTATPVWPAGVMAPFARPARSGCRVWVETSASDTVAQGDPVYVVTVAGTNNPIGTFTNSSTSTTTDCTTVLLQGATFKSAGAATVQLVEFTTPVASTSDATSIGNLNLMAPKAKITAGTEASHVRTITVQAVDPNNVNLAGYFETRIRLNHTAAYGAADATGITYALTAGTAIQTVTANAEYIVRTDSTGKATFTITDGATGATTKYVEAVIGGVSVSSSGITFVGN